jgi:hypothetical protein
MDALDSRFLSRYKMQNKRFNGLEDSHTFDAPRLRLSPHEARKSLLSRSWSVDDDSQDVPDEDAAAKVRHSIIFLYLPKNSPQQYTIQWEDSGTTQAYFIRDLGPWSQEGEVVDKTSKDK